MKEYSYQELLKMQEEAARRVMEMQKRAAVISAREEAPQETQPKKPRHISYPVELESGNKSDGERAESANRERAAVRTGEGLLHTLLSDRDAMLVLSLASLLLTDGGDPLSVLPLLYIIL